ncbi:hypothetical protein LEP1GSC151_0325 [Leptospira interrogans serovar Grippotyphosa str. LT2186]|uniref:Uncharacterized protein n=1 Tax=Leptospira interrogans serovar Grippotyphosa str. LT2186 TaxID=1001599 RepID=M3I3F6_LEPIR|nr:hypothetical protein LEP1GSC097_2988 [Leptospira interrogans serovar Grippotyphosa str. UI 08368]EMG09961.1 hypothetical protein LEP1GSC151_0325 [Leptospira interrogans serovar Grippotyphosa str. LT2186]EMI60633.1 hypothetical protein LEP1GSC200_0664 [Leptospira interrogans serovar Pomona str. CSL10083]
MEHISRKNVFIKEYEFVVSHKGNSDLIFIVVNLFTYL